MNKKLVYIKKTDKKVIKKLVKDFEPALVSLSQKQMNLYIPTYEIVLDIHDVILDVSGGRPGIHVENDIHRAIERPSTYINYKDEYDIDTICALLIDSIARYHGFNDGNKRTALMTAMLTYRINGYHYQATVDMNKSFDLLVMWVVNKKPDIPEIEIKLKKLREKYGAENEQNITTIMQSFIKMRLKKNKLQ